MKKTFSLILSLVIILAAFTQAFGTPLEADLYNQSGEILKNAGVLYGSESGDLMLNQKLKRQDMVILISRLYKEENTAKEYPVKNIFKDVKNSFYKPYISWAVDKGIIIGIDENNFGFNDSATVQQFQTLLLRALEYGEEAKDWNNVPNFSKSLGLMEGLSATPKQDVERGLMAAITVNTLRLTTKGSSMTLAKKSNIDLPEPFSVEETATVDKSTLKLEGIAKGTNTLKINLKLVSNDISTVEINKDIPLKQDGTFNIEISNLQSGNYEYKFLSGSISTQPKSISIQEIPFDLKDAKTTSLKEFAVSYHRTSNCSFFVESL